MSPRTRSQTATPKPTPQIPAFRLRSPAEPPVYRVDLSLPPRTRHRDICRDFKVQLAELTCLYDDVLTLTPFPRFLKFLAKRLLTRVHSSEETEEIYGISEVTGVERHLVIAYNTFLDLFSGCVSGGVRVSDAGKDGRKNGIVHFRGLDWDMEPLRKMIICVEYVHAGEIVARAVTYAGYIGTLTGVRQGLSISLNYRATIKSSSSTFAHRLHQLSLLLGRRPSISSQLRSILLAPGPAPTLADLASSLSKTTSSPCYLTFCSPDGALLVEKDLKSATLETSDDFIAVTNHDKQMEAWSATHWKETLEKEGLTDVGGIQAILQESMERKECVAAMWRELRRAQLRVEDVRDWLETKPVTNECTHFSCVMDPGVEGGGLVWVRGYEESVDMGSFEGSYGGI